VKFAYSMGFSEMVDRMVWPPSLSLDRKWPHPPIRRRSAWNNTLNACNSRYMLEQSIMGQKMCLGIILINLAVRMKCLLFSTIFAINSWNLKLQWKTLIGNNFGRIEDRAVKFAYNRPGFQPWRIQWCDRNLCHVTSDDAYQVVIKQHF